MADLRKCVGSAKFGIAAHEAPVSDFAAQPSQKDGLGRMCREHWTAYTRALRTGSIETKATPATPAKAVPAKVKSRAAAAAEPRVRTAQPTPVAVEPTVAVADQLIAGEAEEDAILVDRKRRVKAWRRSELEGTPEA